MKEGRGGLWHGGFKAVMNHDFLKREHITHIVNTARGLEMFGPKYTVSLYYNILFSMLRETSAKKCTLCCACGSLLVIYTYMT